MPEASAKHHRVVTNHGHKEPILGSLHSFLIATGSTLADS